MIINQINIEDFQPNILNLQVKSHIMITKIGLGHESYKVKS